MIVRVPSGDRDKFTKISNELLYSPTVSPQALGLYCYLLSKPSDWDIKAETIAAVFRGNGSKRVGRKSILAALKELEEEGYVERVKLDSRNFITSTILYESSKPKHQRTKTSLRTSGDRVIKLSCSDRTRFTIINNEVCYKPKLSLRAIGLHSYLLAQKDDWQITYKSLTNAMDKRGERSMGKQTIKDIMSELEDNGYAERVRTGSGLLSMNSDFAIYESNDSEYKLSIWEKNRLENEGEIDLSERCKDRGIKATVLHPQNDWRIPIQEILTDHVVKWAFKVNTISNNDCKGITTVNNLTDCVVDEKGFLKAKTGSYLGLKNTGPRTTKKEGSSEPLNNKTQNTKNETDHTKEFSHVKGQNMSREKKKVERLAEVVQNIEFPNILSSNYRVKKILSELNDEHEGTWLLRESNYNIIQEVLNETARDIKSKKSTVEWERGAHLLIKNRIIDMLDNDEINSALEFAQSQNEKKAADHYQEKLDNWDKLCKESNHVSTDDAPNPSRPDELIAIMIFSQSEEDRDKLHPERSRYLKRHTFYYRMLNRSLLDKYDGMDKVKMGGLNILASKKGIKDLPLFLSNFTKSDLEGVVPDYEHF